MPKSAVLGPGETYDLGRGMWTEIINQISHHQNTEPCKALLCHIPLGFWGVFLRRFDSFHTVCTAKSKSHCTPESIPNYKINAAAKIHKYIKQCKPEEQEKDSSLHNF